MGYRERKKKEKILSDILLLELKMVTPPEQFPQAEKLIQLIPEDYKKEFINMVAFGFEVEKSFLYLKTTYEF